MGYKKLNEQYFDKTESKKKHIETNRYTKTIPLGFVANFTDGSTYNDTTTEMMMKAMYKTVHQIDRVIDSMEWISKDGDWKIRMCVEDYGGGSIMRDDTEDLFSKNGENLIRELYFDYFTEDCSIHLTCNVEIDSSVSYGAFADMMGRTYGLWKDFILRNHSGRGISVTCPLWCWNPSKEEFSLNVINSYSGRRVMKDCYAFIHGSENTEDESSKYNFKYNGGVYLSDEASHDVFGFSIGDVLYSTFDGKLTDKAEGNVPIGICVERSVYQKCAYFVSIHYMSMHNQDKGSIAPSYLRWGDMAANFTYQDLKENTADEIHEIICARMSKIPIKRNALDWYDFPISEVVGTVSLYRTLGTKEGDWFLPWCFDKIGGSLYNFTDKDNFAKISEARKELCGYGYNEGEYWTSSEASGTAAFTLSPLNEGNREQQSYKGDEHFAVAYLKVMNPQS